ncbi:MAG: D-alanyl-D-alanine carboxypeptidase family protein [Candidatus Paraimprobicoccus trichonymphae]|uniref:D-alanyl-D-alanine carboxypeptidase family protein n=1 Tax=Candidatus Paraimprobicoccus trichonymphae TaxID=3033793 RepID=A0AA48L032_9FIRM|nr:MAG: D-alanyl-D-alanine carboxypeptidase family protein [Candidatus Paraimprobicoccus trichonymphae]
MKKYKRLSQKDIKRINFMKKVRLALKQLSVFLFLIIFIITFFVIGIVYFYKFIDKETISSENSNNDILIEKIKEPDELLDSEKEELEILEKSGLAAREETKKSTDKKEFSKKNLNKLNSYDFSEWHKTCPEELIIVNSHNLLDKTHIIKTKLCRNKEIAVCVAEPLENMIVAANKENIKLFISSGYRSIEYQKKLFENQVEREINKGFIEKEKAEEQAQTVVAKPGASEHNLGIAADFNGVLDNFANTKEYEWLTKNAHKFGFVERYTKKFEKTTGIIPEPWHWRYVGEEHAKKIRESGLSLEEYVYKKIK